MFNASSKWWSLALHRFFIYQIVTIEDKEEIEEVFKYIDTDLGGDVDRAELTTGLTQMDPNLTSRELYQNDRQYQYKLESHLKFLYLYKLFGHFLEIPKAILSETK